MADSNNQHGFCKLANTIYGPIYQNIMPVWSVEGELLKDHCSQGKMEAALQHLTESEKSCGAKHP